MKRFLFAFILVNIYLTAFCQDFIKVDIVKHQDVANAEWQVTDLNKIAVFAETDYPDADTTTLIIDKNKAYYIAVSITEVKKENNAVYTILFDGEEEFTVGSSLGCGDHYIPFNTGTGGGEAKIIGGSNADITDFPWQIFLHINHGDYYYQCGGTIIADKWILTAAHCTFDDNGNDFSADSMLVLIGDEDLSKINTAHIVKNVIKHADYNDDSYANDIALLELKTAITFSEKSAPIKMVTEGDAAEGYTDPGVMATITGWGETNSSTHASPNILQQVQLPIVSRNTALNVWSSIPAKVIMAGYQNGTKDACRGDSGGPLIVPVGEEGFKLAGIVSWGNTKCNTYGAYTEVSAFRDWITENSGIHENSPDKPEGDSLICQGVETSIFTTNMLENAESYEWELSPASAGTVNQNDTSATVTWNSNFKGEARIKVRAAISGISIPTAWSHKVVTVAENTAITGQSGNVEKCVKESFKLELNTTGHNVTYSWYKDGNIIAGNTSNILTRNNTSESHSGVYYCVATGTCGTLRTENMRVNIRPLTTIISSTPDTTVNFGSNTNLKVNATGHNLSYQWKKNGVDIDNASLNTLSFTNINANDIGTYSVKITGTCGTVSTLQRYLYVNRDINPANPDIYVWPTLTRDIIHVAPSNNNTYSIKIFNSIGKLMFEGTEYQYESEIDISYLPRGMYIVQVTAGSMKKAVKIIKSE